ncbi:MAG: alkaline phosphatase family protein [Acidimicrobiia bacterium]|nr:alkaline phosphatase family protein [Acidimicrobiia bacterium]
MPGAASTAGSGGGRIDHVVVLMLENRSFDNLLGFLEHPKADEFDGLTRGPHHNVNAAGTAVAATADGLPSGVDPDHSHEGALRQMEPFGDVAANGGFVRSYETVMGEANADVVMKCLDPAAHCPVMAELALEFAVCTAWFSSVPGETWPNRNFAHAATSDNTVNIEAGLYYDRTIFEVIAKKNKSWHIYYDGTPQVWCYPRLWRPRTFVDFLLRRPANIGNWFEYAQFADHAAAGTLPSYSFIEPAHNRFYSPEDAPRRTTSQHPHNNLESADDFAGGDALIASVYETLRANPTQFAKTLLVITYDEHGGLYDHVSPPSAVPPGDRVWRGLSRLIGRWLRARADREHKQQRNKNFDFRRLGVRVPAVLVSPWIAPATIVGERLEHASIPKTLRELFAPDAKPLTDRDRAAAAFHGVVVDSPLGGPRPDPGGPNPLGLPPLPDLSGAARAAPPTHRTMARGAGGGRVGEAATGPTIDPEPDNPVDAELARLADCVDKRLRRRPATVLARRRAEQQAQPQTLMARTGETFPAEEAVSLFTAATKVARRAAGLPRRT